MYTPLLTLHSWIRWIALLVVVFVLVRSVRALAGDGRWTPADTKWLKGAAHAMTLQFLLGIFLFAVSPYIRNLMGDMATTMRDRTSRFFVVEHAAIMFLALASIHVGVLMTRGATTDRARHVRVAVCVGIALALAAYGIPWDRPLLR